jgi:dienelactone hydrolase
MLLLHPHCDRVTLKKANHTTMKCILLCAFVLQTFLVRSQTNALFTNLPVGRYAVGFKIVTLVDSSRVDKPLYNYFGEKEPGDRHHKISVHIWYPAKKATGKETLTYGDYCYNHLLSHTGEVVDEARKSGMVNNYRNYFEGFFGKVSDTAWQRLLATQLLAQKDAEPLKEKFPLLIGMLRPLSTSVANELMASNGYIVAMIVNSGGRIPLSYISDVADMQQAIAYLNRTATIDADNIGTYGFSGSGFSQVLLAMNDPRIKALADMESALYGEGIWALFSSSNYYNAANLRIPFLHIYGKELAKGDTHFAEFHKKKYAHRYHLLLNYPRLHHWDVATEGRASTTVLHIRGDKEPGIRASFELAHLYLLAFFDAALKGSSTAQQKLANKPAIGSYHDSLWSMQQYPALPAPPNRQQFEELVLRKGIDSAVALARRFYALDSAAEFLHENALNASARQLAAQNKPKEGLALMHLAVELHPQEAWLWNNLADMHDNAGNKADAIKYSEKTLELLKDVAGTGQSFNERIKRGAAARLERLRKG